MPRLTVGARNASDAAAQQTTDEGAGARVGSRISLSGKAFGLSLFLDEEVAQYEPPIAKTWETLGEPMLLVIGAYRMGFGIGDGAEHAKLCVFIDYDLPRNSFTKVLGFLFGHFYASWCVRSMLADAAAHFRAVRADRKSILPVRNSA